jgi:hypothetical protein
MKNLKTYNQFITEGNSGSGEYSYKEMRDFLERIIPNMAPFEKSYRGPSISIPTDRNSSSVVYEIEDQALLKFDKSYKKFKSDKPLYYIWNFSFNNSQLNSKVKMINMQRIDLKSLYQASLSNPGELERMSISFTSKNQSDFADNMSSGKYGPLD